MTDHYYTDRPTAAHDRRTVTERLRGRELIFLTDAGVFSKSGIDFGSRLLIETMEIGSEDKVLDVGCGYGPIGLSAALLADRGEAVLVDINERAVELARENAKRNRIANVRILQSNLLEGVAGETFDCILTNPPIRAGKETVHRIFSQAYACLKSGGVLWVVIRKKQGAPSAFARLESIFGTVEEAAKEKGYRIYKCRKNLAFSLE